MFSSPGGNDRAKGGLCFDGLLTNRLEVKGQSDHMEK